MLTGLFSRLLLAFHLAAAPAPASSEAALAVAEALVDADQVLDVHESAGVIVLDLDRAGERFQLTVALDDDGRVVASAIDWVGPTDDAPGVAAPAVADLQLIERIDWQPGRRVRVLRGGGRAARLTIAAPT